MLAPNAGFFLNSVFTFFLYSIFFYICFIHVFKCRCFDSQFFSVSGVAYSNFPRINIDGCFASRCKESCSNPLLT